MKNSQVKRQKTFLDLFAGAGGLSEGFIRAGFKPVSHIEMNPAACCTLKTRMAYHHLRESKKLDIYVKYLKGEISRSELWSSVPQSIINSVIESEIGSDTLHALYESTQALNGKRKHIDVIVGGPPCQAYSIAGRARDENKMQGDKRNWLFKYYADFLRRFKPKYFVFENVLGLLSAKDENGQKYFELMREEFKNAGYDSKYKVISAEEYGVPQNRKRIIIIGKRTNMGNATNWNYPELAPIDNHSTVSDVLDDLPSMTAGGGDWRKCDRKRKPHNCLHEMKIASEGVPITMHIARPNTDQDLEIYKTVVQLWNAEQKRLVYDDLPENLKTHQQRGYFKDRFKVVAGNLKSSQTIVAHISRDGHYYIHPDIDQNRSITPREAARLQTFPDDYYFEGESCKPCRTAAYRQIGNAVPVLLAEKIASSIISNW